MSRSYKHHPFLTDGSAHTTKKAKRFASKRVRRADWDDIPLKGNGYKKYTCSYDIHDWITRYSKEEAIERWYSGRYPWIYKEYKDIEDYMKNWWERWYRRK